MQPDTGLRMGLTVETMAELDEGLLPVLGVPSVMLSGMIAPLPLLWAMTLPFGLIILLLGHPVIAATATVLSLTADTIVQRLYQRWRRVVEDEPEKIMRRICVAISLRAVVASYGAVAVVVARPGLAEIAFMGLISGLLLCVAITQGTLSRILFWLSAAPVIAGLLLAIAVSFPPRETAALLGTVAILICFLGMMAGSTSQILGDWAFVREKNNRLIERLRAEREEADLAREEARRAGQAKANFLATMSHEIRTPMNGVLGMAQLLRTSAHDDRQRGQIETLIHSGEFLLSILNDILDISKIDVGQLDITTEREELRGLFDDIDRLWRPTAEEKGLTLDIRIAADVPAFVEMDARRVRQILFNLMGNALKFTASGGVSVVVGSESAGPDQIRLTVAVEDTGIGIAADVLPLLFERFSQADQSISRKFGGAGLGLAISRQLSELMHGDLWVESRPGVGATFHLSLPLKVVAAPQALAAPAPASADDATPLSVLIVDDNPVNLTVLDQILKAFGHHVTRAGGGREALSLASARPYDLILLDIQMPGMSGVEVLQAMRASDSPNRATRALAVTADVLSRDRGGYLALGFCGHIAKPIRVSDLAEEVVAVMAAPAPLSVAA